MRMLYLLFSLTLGQPTAIARSPDVDGPIAQPTQARPGLAAKRRTKYRWSQVWQSAMRLIRVDKGWTIQDSNQEAGYLLFHEESTQDYPAQGSIELIAQGDKDSGAGILVRAKVSNAGTHAAFLLLQALEKKLRADFGPPPLPKKPPKKAPKEPEKPKVPEDPKTP